MGDSVDLRKLLKSWPYDPESDSRIAQGDDGRDILQIRTPLGIEQYELDGRPDGESPHGSESVLEYQLHRLEQAKAEGREAEFELDPKECGELFHEGTLFYFRYVRLFELKDWTRTVRDTARNLRAFDFVHRYAQRGEDQQFLEKWRPYIIRIHASASAMLEIDQNHHDLALEATQEAIQKILGLEELDDETFKFERERSVTALKELAAQITKSRPLSRLEQLEHQLKRAIERQEFERAAKLRDQIRELRRSDG
jgi:hypothetical protein